MKPEPDELELAIRARSGDSEALAELIERLRLGLFALAYAELRHYEDAQDAVAAALYQICCHAVDLREPKTMRAWTHTIVRNETHRIRRDKQAVYTSLDEAISVGMEDPSPLLRLDIERALRQLPRDQARAIGLFYLSGWPITAKISIGFPFSQSWEKGSGVEGYLGVALTLPVRRGTRA
jgi:RNA polymerase sigma-70 factor, ECF subfamily